MGIIYELGNNTEFLEKCCITPCGVPKRRQMPLFPTSNGEVSFRSSPLFRHPTVVDLRAAADCKRPLTLAADVYRGCLPWTSTAAAHGRRLLHTSTADVHCRQTGDHCIRCTDVSNKLMDNAFAYNAERSYLV